MNKQYSTVSSSNEATRDNWWQGGVIYQIYPRSFQDSNNDGIGDLRGIIHRLDYIANLGVDAIWISPFFTSPMQDFGYDVSDYCNIDPLFGNMADFDMLLQKAHDLGLRVMIDLVLSHSSDQHPWFTESRQSRDNSKSDWYVWADAQPDGTAPNNWLSIFGGSAWQWDPRREQYYLHNFLPSQPDLNFHNPKVQDALLDVTRFWLDKGIDGFRLDTINFYFHDKELRSNPPLPKSARNALIAPSVNPYNHQLHLYSKNQSENLDFLKRFRSLLNEYTGVTALGEVGDAQKGLEILAEYTAGKDRVHMCYAFEFLEPQRPTAEKVKAVFDDFQQVAKDGWACWAFSNHDVQRHCSRWALSAEAQYCFTQLLMTMRGSVCLYQGEELGFTEADVPFEAIQDPYGIEFWPEFKGRDGCRTPIAWEENNNGGFSQATPWLPMDAQQLTQAASKQIHDEDSMYHRYKAAIAMRHAYPALAFGQLIDIQTNDNLLSFRRKHHNQEIYCAFNLGETTVTAPMPKGAWSSLTVAMPNMVLPQNDMITFKPWQCCLLLGQENNKGSEHG